MQNNPFIRIENMLVIEMEKPSAEDFMIAWNVDLPAYEKALSEYNSRPSYPINHADLDKFEEGKQYEKDKHFYLDYSDPMNPTAFPLPTPNDRREESDVLNYTNEMCIESLDPKSFEKWEEIKSELIKNRKVHSLPSTEPMIKMSDALKYGEWTRNNGERFRGSMQKNGKELYEQYLKETNS